MNFLKYYLLENEINGLSDIVIEWWKNYNPFEDEGLYLSDIKEIYLIGSRAKGTHHDSSDYDVGIVFPSELKDEYDAIKLSEILHQKYGNTLPLFNENDVDLQIFFDDDDEFKKYKKLKLK